MENQLSTIVSNDSGLVTGQFQRGFVRPARRQRQANRGRRFQCVGHVKIVRPGFRPILPRMGRCVGRDEIFLPENRSARLVVTLERFGIILPLVAEDAAQSRGVLFVSEEPVPIVVADLMPKMSKDGPVGFIPASIA